MTFDTDRKLIELAIGILRDIRLNGHDYASYLGALEAARLPIEELGDKRSGTILKTVDSLLDEKAKATIVDLEGGVIRVLGMLNVVVNILDIEEAPQSSDALIPTFELSENDASRLFELCGQMRRIILGSDVFDEPHRLRLLNRIAAIEAETHKPKGMFDVVRGGINDLGETLGKFGKDVKPLTDRMREVVSIARKGSKQYEQLPEPDEVKRLPAPDQDEDQ